MELKKRKKMLVWIANLQKLIEKFIFKILNRVFEQKSKVTTAPDKGLRVAFPSDLENISNIIKSELQRNCKRNCKL